MSIFAKCMENDADHNVGRMKLDHGPTQVAPPWFLVTRAAVLRHGAICDNGGRGLEKKKNRCSLTAGLSLPAPSNISITFCRIFA